MGGQQSDIDADLSSASYVKHEWGRPPQVSGAFPPFDWSADRNYDSGSPRSLAANLAAQQSSAEATAPQTQFEQEPLFSGPRNRMPYFRWLGPTAIMPGFKQMVVKVKRQDTDMGRSSTDGIAAGMTGSPSLNGILHHPSVAESRNLYPATPAAATENEFKTPLNLPFYDTSPMPPSELITDLANTFFTHLGCNYPFLQRERFLRDLEEKQVDAILVDAVCAIAARFSTHPLLTQQASGDENEITPAHYGHAFAQRAQIALVDTFSCPTVAAVQAALLLAYVEFGESRDSGLWMYLGISIRMAQDLGLHKVEGLKYRGKTGPTPKMVKRESMSGSPSVPPKVTLGERGKKKSEEIPREPSAREQYVRPPIEKRTEIPELPDDPKAVEDQKAAEDERIHTFWAVFFLDKMISSGTGRRGTWRDKDIEVSFPPLDTKDEKSGWPTVFPALIRIVHLYGRVADLLNSLKEPSDITTDTPKRLASMESHVTNFYSGLSPRLHFDAVNFQHYMKAGEGTNFVLLHFWFHTLIVLLHRPTLLMTFEGKMLQLFPNSQQLSMSSAKTIADILSYSQLMDAKASLGNPFTTQPIYIAACAFLKETAEQTASSTTQSRASSPSRRERPGTADRSGSNSTPSSRKRMSIAELAEPTNPSSGPRERGNSTATELNKSSERSEDSALSATKTANAVAKHTLLATAATQHYSLCYKALQSLETYWAGTKYILTVLDQKFQGVGDPLLYTVDEGNSAMEKPKPEPSFTSPGWRRKLSWGPYLYNPNLGAQDFWKEKATQIPGSPAGDLGKAIGWTLTGTMNSPSTNLAWHYPGGTATGSGDGLQRQLTTESSAASLPYSQPQTTGSNHGVFHPQAPSLMPYTPANGMSAGTPDMSLLHPTTSNPNISEFPDWPSRPCVSSWPWGSSHHQQQQQQRPALAHQGSSWNLTNSSNDAMMLPFGGDMMIESQDIDLASMFGSDVMMPWFDTGGQGQLSGLFDQGQAQGGSGGGGGNGTPQ